MATDTLKAVVTTTPSLSPAASVDTPSTLSFSTTAPTDVCDKRVSGTAAAQDWTTPIRHQGRWFRDEFGRTLLMRGINIGGSSKLPTRPYPGSTHLYDEQFWDHRAVSFVDRPFPLAEARNHFERIRAWGLTLVRLLVPWEALEHAGPGEYDESYIDYLRALIAMMPEYGLKCLIDPHQDTWSRFSGGSGAPGWTFEVAGMDMRTFKETGAAYVHNTNAVPGDPLPMVWPTNYTKLASCTMFTLFFAGDTFAPRHTHQGKSIQHLLSTSFIGAFRHLATRLRHLEAVVGFEVMNEPHPGYIGLKTLDKFDPIVNLMFGDSPTPLQSFALGDGIPQSVGVYAKSWPVPTRKTHHRVINQSRTSAWRGDQSCIWREHGVWTVADGKKPRLLNTTYFSKHPDTGKEVDFYADFYVPFVNRYADAIQSVRSDWFCFVEPLANEYAPVLSDSDHHENVVYAPHWYDLNCVFYKKFDGRLTHDVQSLQRGGNVISATYFGRKGAKKNYTRQLHNIKMSGITNMGEKPCIVGEAGIPMDLNDRFAFETGDYKHHNLFLDAVIHAMEANLMSFILWNYDVCNDNEHGDHWNGENFSIYSAKHRALHNTKVIDALHHGGRVLDAALRPYASKIAGHPLVSKFDMDTLEYTLVFMPFSDEELKEQAAAGFDVESHAATETHIFVPDFHYRPTGLDVTATVGEWHYKAEKQTLYHWYSRSDHKEASITLRLRSDIIKSASASKGCNVM